MNMDFKDGFLVFANADKDGEIEGIAGYNIVPHKQFKYYFFLDKQIDLMDYKIIDGKLVKK